MSVQTSLSLINTDTSPRLFEHICSVRGWTPRFLVDVNCTKHDKLRDLDRLVDRMRDVKTSGGVITIAPDFDMDGITSGITAYAGLSELGFRVHLYIPDYTQGHTFSPNDVTRIAQQFPDTTVVMTCDGGVNAHTGIAAAREQGWETWVTDHHAELPPGSTADITINPCRMDETYAHPGICGAHVVYQILSAYAHAHQPDKTWEIRLLALFAGIGTVADVMPMLYENRHVVKQAVSLSRLLYTPAPRSAETNAWGEREPEPKNIDIFACTLLSILRLQEHSEAYMSAFTGFAVVLKAFACAGKLRSITDLDEGFFGFYLAPAMNHPRRIGGSLDDCFAVFTETDIDAKFAAMERVIAGNERRKELVAMHLEQLHTEPQPYAPYVFTSAANQGMFGLLAQELAQQYGHPVVVGAQTPDGEFSGSTRAPEWCDMIDVCSTLPGVTALGHAQACGVRSDDVSSLRGLIDRLDALTQQAQREADEHQELDVDCIIGDDRDALDEFVDPELYLELCARIDQLKPFGRGFEEPQFGVYVDLTHASIRLMGSEKQHCRIITHAGMTVIWWNIDPAVYEQLTSTCTRAAFACRLSVNTFRGIDRVQAIAHAWLPIESIDNA